MRVGRWRTLTDEHVGVPQQPHLFLACSSVESIGRWKKMARGSCDKKVPLAASKEDSGGKGLLQARKPPRNVRR